MAKLKKQGVELVEEKFISYKSELIKLQEIN